MEQLGTITQVAFDKTGTLTEGTPRISEILPLKGIDANGMLAAAAAAEGPSEHPLARAIVNAATERNLAVHEATEFRSTPGCGVTALVASRRVQVGSPALLAETDSNEVRAVVTGLETTGRTAVVVLIDGTVQGVLGLVDRLRPAAKDTVAALTAVTGNEPVLLTGDNAAAATRLGTEVGIDDVRAGLLPQHKVAEVASLHAAGRRVLVVGDGVNDAPALAAADIGVAMGRHGSDLALETADAVIVRDELDTLPAIIELSKRARGAVVQNLVFASAAILTLITWDLLGHLPLPLGVAGHEGGTVLVGLNGLRLLRANAWSHSTKGLLIVKTTSMARP
jgi:P-type E1-E2 ATPase